MLADQPLSRYLLPIAAFAIVMAFGLWCTGLSQKNRINQSRLERHNLLADIRSEIERDLAVTLTSTEILAHEVVRARGQPSDFKVTAQRILDQIGGISNLQLAPNGIIRQIHPLAGNVEALGHDTLKDRRRNAEALVALNSGSLTLVGPINLVQGGVAVIARKPVYLWENDIRPVNMADSEASPPFWGFVSALIMLDELLDSPALSSLAYKGYSYYFSRMDPRKNTHVKFAKHGTLNAARADTINISIPNGSWTLHIGNDDAIGISRAAIEIAVTFLLALLLAVIIWFSLQRQGVRTTPQSSLHRDATEERH